MMIILKATPETQDILNLQPCPPLPQQTQVQAGEMTVTMIENVRETVVATIRISTGLAYLLFANPFPRNAFTGVFLFHSFLDSMAFWSILLLDTCPNGSRPYPYGQHTFCLRYRVHKAALVTTQYGLYATKDFCLVLAIEVFIRSESDDRSSNRGFHKEMIQHLHAQFACF